MPRTRFLLLIAALIAAPLGLRGDATAGAPPAQNILVITGTSTFGAFPGFLGFMQQTSQWNYCTADMAASGFITEMQTHTVTVMTSVPGSLAGYTQVWDMRFDQNNCTTAGNCGTNLITAGQQTQYLNYIAGGGSLFLLGDNSQYVGRNDPILAIAKAVDANNTFGTGGVGWNGDNSWQGAYIDNAQATLAENFQSDYRDISGGINGSGWIATQQNGLIPDWGAGYAVARDNDTNQAVAVAFDCANEKALYKPGKLFVAMDWQMFDGGGQVNICGPPGHSGTSNGYNERFWENIVDFLVPGNVCTSPTPTPTKTRTVTSTVTRTASQTPSPASTNTFTPTLTLTQTSTSTRTASVTVTVTPSPTQTSTSTLSSTSTSSRTASPSLTLSSTLTSTRTASPTHTITSMNTATNSPTVTSTRTASVTVTDSPTQTLTSTSTSTRTASPTVSYSATQTLTATPSSTRTPSATVTSTSTISPLASPTNTPTITVTSTSTSTRTASPSMTITSTVTLTSTATSTITETIAFSATNTRTSTLTLTSTSTRTASPTVTHTRSSTDTRTPTSTRTASPTITVSPTLSASPVPMPFHIDINVYNSAGELVGQIYQGGVSQLPDDIKLDQDLFFAGTGQVGVVFTGDLASGGNVVYWHGLNSYAQAVAAGIYYVKMDVKDPFGKVSSYSKAVQVAPAVAARTLSVFNSAGELVWQSVVANDLQQMQLRSEAFAPQLDPTTGTVNNPLRLDFKNSLGATVSQYWDGRNQEGQLVDAGTYTIKLTQSRPGSQSSVETASVVVIRGDDKSIFEKSVLGPNPASGNSIVITYLPIPGTQVSASVFNLAGERVANGADPYAGGKVSIDISRLTSGIYVVCVSSGKDRKVLKLSVVH